MALWHIFLNEIKLTLRNPVGLILILLMPIMMICLMGYALKPVFNIQEKGIERFRILYFNQDEGALGKAFEDSTSASGLFDVVTANEQSIKEGLKSGEFPAALIMPSDFSERIISGEEPEIEIIGTGKDLTKESIVQAMVRDFVRHIRTRLMINEAFIRAGVADATKETQEVIGYVETEYRQQLIAYNPVYKTHAETMTSEQYFSVTMLVFFLLAMGTGLGVSIINDRDKKLESRMISYPVSMNQILLGKAFSNILVGVLQSAFIIAFSSLVFNINWGSNLFGTSLVVISVMLFSSGAATAFASFVRSAKAISAGLMVVFWMMTFISGGFFRLPAFSGISKYTVNYWAFEAIAGFMAGEGFAKQWNHMLALAATGIVTWTAGVVFYKRRASNE